MAGSLGETGAWARAPLAGRRDISRIYESSAALREVERQHIVTVLKRTGWRIDGPRGAARLLDLHPSTLRSRMQKLGIRRSAAELS